MPGPRPHSRIHAAVPRHNSSRGCQQGAANRDARAFQPQLQVSAPPPSPLCTALPALLRVLFIVISPLLAAGVRGGGSGLGTAPEGREGKGAQPVVPARQGRGEAPRSPRGAGRSQPYCVPQTFPAARSCRFWGSHGLPPMPGRGETPPCLRNPLLRAFPHQPLDPRPPTPTRSCRGCLGFSSSPWPLRWGRGDRVCSWGPGYA